MEQAAAALRQMRIVHAILVLYLLLLVPVSERIANPGVGFTTTFLAAIALAAVVDGLIAYLFWRIRLVPAMEKLRRDPNDFIALKAWKSTTILCLVLALSIALYGLVIRVLGGSRQVSWTFFGLALILIVMWRPKLELSAGVSSAHSDQ